MAYTADRPQINASLTPGVDRFIESISLFYDDFTSLEAGEITFSISAFISGAANVNNEELSLEFEEFGTITLSVGGNFVDYKYERQ